MSQIDAGRLAGIDSLRLAAAALVLLQHVADRMTGPVWQAVAAMAPGVAGVVLFFLISGFVIPFSVRGRFNPRTFAIRRVMRIYPLYLVALGIALAGGLSGLLANWAWLPQLSLAGWIANLLLVQDFAGQRAVLGVSWTLIIEFGWYALFAMSVLVFRSRALRVLGWAMPLGIAALALVSLAQGWRIPLARPGMIYAAVLGYQLHAWHAGQIGKRAMETGLATFIMVMGAAILVSFGHFIHPRIGLVQALVPWMLVPLGFAAVVAQPGLLGTRLLSSGLLPRLGAASYSLYLLHPIALAAAFSLFASGLAAIAGILFSLGLAQLAYRWVELPGIALGRHLAGGVPRREAVAA